MRIYDYELDANLAAVIKAIFERPQCLSKVGSANKGSSDPDAKTTAIAYFKVNNIFYSKAATDPIDLSATTAGLAATAGTGTQAAGKYAAYLLTLTSGGTFDLLKGADATTAALALNALPAPATNTCPVAILVVANTTNVFVVGTTNLDASGVTTTWYDLSDIPPTYGTGALYKNTVTDA